MTAGLGMCSIFIGHIVFMFFSFNSLFYSSDHHKDKKGFRGQTCYIIHMWSSVVNDCVINFGVRFSTKCGIYQRK